MQTVHPAKAVIDDGVSPLEAQFCVEVAQAAIGMSAEEANVLVNQLLEKYEKEVDKAPAGKRYQECYDPKTGQPSDDYLSLYKEIKDELANMGIPF